MTEQLTSVRFARETLTALKQLAELHDGSVAAEIRSAVEAHITACMSAPDFAEQVERKKRERAASADEFASTLLGMAATKK